MFTLQDLMEAFCETPNFAWEVLYSEINLHQSSAIDTGLIKQLIELYSRGMERINLLQHSTSNYFKAKINDLMGERRVMHCLNDGGPPQLSLPAAAQTLPASERPSFDRELHSRKRQLQIRLAYDIQNSSEHLRSIMNSEQLRQKKMLTIIAGIFDGEESKLKEKIKRRQSRIETMKSIKRQQHSNSTSNQENIDPIAGFQIVGEPLAHAVYQL